IENLFEFPDGQKAWFELRMEPVPGGIAILSIDVTEGKSLEESLRSHVRTLDILERCKSCLIQSKDEASLLDSFCETIAHTLGYASVTVERFEDSASAQIGT